MPSPDQQESFKAVLKLLLEGDGNARPEFSKVKSPSALSRFLNLYPWNARSLICKLRQQALEQLEHYHQHRRGRRPLLYVSIDLTTLEKTGEFPELPIHSLNGKRGLHLVVLYLLIGEVRIPWGFRVWRGAGTASPAELALKLLRSLPMWLKQHFRLRILADGGFGGSPFLEGVAAMKLDTVVGMRHDRKLEAGGKLHDIKKSSQQVQLEGLSLPLWAARFILKKPDGSKEWRYVVATFQVSAKTLIRSGKKRFAIEGFFKVAKHRFSLARFGQRTAQGVYRYLVLSLIAFMLSHWHALATGQTILPDWKALAQEVRRLLLPEMVFAELLVEMKRLKPYLKAYHPALAQWCKL